MIRTRLLVMLALTLSFAACTKENITSTEETMVEQGREGLEKDELLTANEKGRNFVLFKVDNANVTAGSSFCVDVKAAGFNDIKLIDITKTTIAEQRCTDWMQFESLVDFLDKEDDTKTIEGYPAPIRALLLAYK